MKVYIRKLLKTISLILLFGGIGSFIIYEGYVAFKFTEFKQGYTKTKQKYERIMKEYKSHYPMVDEGKALIYAAQVYLGYMQLSEVPYIYREYWDNEPYLPCYTTKFTRRYVGVDCFSNEPATVREMIEYEIDKLLKILLFNTSICVLILLIARYLIPKDKYFMLQKD